MDQISVHLRLRRITQQDDENQAQKITYVSYSAKGLFQVNWAIITRNKDMAEIARWVRGKVVLRQAEQAREVA